MAFEGWVDGIPPREWKRALAIDVGGASPWAFLWTAVDPAGFVVAYDQIYKTTTDVDDLVALAMPKMVYPPSKEEYDWLFKVIDYENKVAAEDLRRRKIVVTNAVKHNKLASIHRLAGYFHPNKKRPFPSWHPRAGQPGSPLLFITQACKDLIREIPQQRWKEGTGGGDSLKDEADRAIPNHITDCTLYTVRLLPPAADVKIVDVITDKNPMSLMSRLYWEDVKKRKELEAQNGPRRPYNASHQPGGKVA